MKKQPYMAYDDTDLDLNILFSSGCRRQFYVYSRYWYPDFTAVKTDFI